MAKLTIVQIKRTQYGTFAIHYTNPDGRRRRFSVGKDERQAYRQADRFTDWLLDGKDPERELQSSMQRQERKAITVCPVT